ncbi:MAG TPA: TonB-dependent receptor [Planctomycetota bacterium]|nr:TonB-dependent receptor [Planctomycetota bacterium]
MVLGALVHLLVFLIGTPAGIAAPQDAPATQPKTQDVTDLDLDDLVNVRVTSVARKEQTLTDVPAAVYVIRQEDLRRSGARSIPEALRSVPGLEVAEPNGNSWAISGRGFNNTSANGLLVMFDGRSVYSPLHSGVFWDVQDTFLEDIDRIEVIRGPGGTLWGSNAVNGVINIITKPAEDTQGFVLTGGAGTEERAFGGARAGFKAAEDVYVRTYVQYFSRDGAVSGLDTDREAFDAQWMARTGFRTDWKANDHDRVTLTGDMYEGQSQTSGAVPSLTAPFSSNVNERADLRGADFVFRWDRTIDPTSGLALQAYYDYSSRLQSIFGYVLHTLDLDFQHRFHLFDGHEINWGLGYRSYWSDVHETFSISSNPKRDFNDVASGFLQDDMPLVKDHLRLTLGSKVEYNSFSGVEAQPSARLAWKPSDVHMAWASASRAVRTPSTLDQDLRINALVIPGAPPTVLSVFGDPTFKSEELLAYEAGYRLHPAEPLFFDLATFYNRYNHLRSLEPGPLFSETDPAPNHNVLPFFIENNLRAQTYRVELAANAKLATWWLVQANYTFLKMDIDPKQDSNDTTSRAGELQNPRNQVWVRSAMDLPENLTLDLIGRYVDRLPAFAVESYIDMDVRLAWQDSTRHIEVAVVGQNLLHDSHAEFSAAGQRSEIPRGAYGSVTVRF